MSELPGNKPLGKRARSWVWISLSGAIAILAILVIAPPELKKRVMRSHQFSAVQACKAFAEAEEIYRRKDYDKDDVLEYAQSLQELGRVGLISKEFADAEIGSGREVPYNGYVFRVLTAQSQTATGGARLYIKDGNMTLGYGLAAYPAVYDVSARDTFIISNNGTIFQQDQGEEKSKQRLPDIFDPPAGVWNHGE